MVVADPTSPYADPTSHALVVCAAASLPELHGELENLGYRITVAADPYQAVVELLDRPTAYDAFVLSLPSLYREELSAIRTVRERLAHLDVFLAHTDGRHAALAEGMRLGATGLLGEEGIHRLANVDDAAAAPAAERPPECEVLQSSFGGTVIARNEPSPPTSVLRNDDDDDEPLPDANDPLLTADELRALLQEQPTLPPG